MKYYLLLMFCQLSYYAHSQMTYKLAMPHYMENKDTIIEFVHDFRIGGKFVHSQEGKYFVSGEFINPLGEMNDLQYIDSINMIKVVGQYASGLDTLVNEILSVNFNGDFVHKLVKFITPHPTGRWVYYDLLNKKNESRIRMFDDGIEIFNRK